MWNIKKGVRIAEASTRRDYQSACKQINDNNTLTVPVSMENLALSGGTLLNISREVDTEPLPKIFGCVYFNKVDWYLGVIKYLNISPSERGKGYAKTLLSMAINFMKDSGVRCLQSTIRNENTASENLFKSFGFKITNYFISSSERQINIFQKVFDCE
jgi:RimJ/RimL family protein N-acetyltransferase